MSASLAGAALRLRRIREQEQRLPADGRVDALVREDGGAVELGRFLVHVGGQADQGLEALTGLGLARELEHGELLHGRAAARRDQPVEEVAPLGQGFEGIGVLAEILEAPAQELVMPLLVVELAGQQRVKLPLADPGDPGGDELGGAQLVVDPLSHPGQELRPLHRWRREEVLAHIAPRPEPGVVLR